MMFNESRKRRKTCADDANVNFEDAISALSAMLMKPEVAVR